MSGGEMIKLPILDGHNDTLNMMFVPGENKRPFLRETNSGHIDLPRAKRGRICGGFFSIFVPHPENHGQETPPDASQERPTIRVSNLEPVDFSYAHRLERRELKAFLRWNLTRSGSSGSYVRQRRFIQLLKRTRSLRLFTLKVLSP